MKPKLSTLAGLLALLPVLYVLSIGPAYRYYVDFYDPGDMGKRQTLRKIYAPLYWLCENVPRVAGAFDWYTDLWKRRPKP